MTPEELGQRAEALLDGVGTAGVDDGRDWRRAVLDVPRERWLDAATAVRDEPDLELAYFDWLTGVDDLPAGFAVVAHLWSVRHRHGLLLRTAVPAGDPV